MPLQVFTAKESILNIGVPVDSRRAAIPPSFVSHANVVRLNDTRVSEVIM
jgi:hypothetical protein